MTTHKTSKQNHTDNNGGTPHSSLAANDHAEVQASAEQAGKFRAAYESLAAERAALPEDGLVHINVDIPTAVNTALGNFPVIQKFAAEAKGLPGFDMNTIEKLDVYAEGLAFAQMLYNAASKPVPVVPDLADEVAKERQKLLASAEALAARGYLDATRLRDLKGGPGYKNIAYDVGTLVAMMRAAWPQIEGKTAVTQDELTNAQVLTEKLLLSLAAREQQNAASTAAADERSRAFTLFSNAYDQVRRAATYLHWGESIDDIAPSFYNGRAAGGGHTATAAAPPDAPATAAAPAAAAAPAKPADGAAAQPGMPGASPFANGSAQ